MLTTHAHTQVVLWYDDSSAAWRTQSCTQVDVIKMFTKSADIINDKVPQCLNMLAKNKTQRSKAKIDLL